MQKNTELTAILMPDGSIGLEWTSPAAAGLNHSSQAMQDEVLARFTEEPDGWLFFLGFCGKSVPLPPSLTFWRTDETIQVVPVWRFLLEMEPRT